MEGLRRLRPVGHQIKTFEDVQHLDDEDAARRGRSHPADLVAPVRPPDGGALDRAVGGEVGHRDQAVGGRGVGDDQAGGLARVELVPARLGDPGEGPGEVGLDESIPLAPGGAVGLPIGRDRRREVGEAVGLRPEVLGDIGDIDPLRVEELGVQAPGEGGRDGEALAGEADGGPDQVGPLRLTEPLVGQGEPPDRPRDARRPRPGAVVGQELAVGPEIHPGRRGDGGDLAEVERDDLLGRRPIRDDEPAPSEVPRRRMRDRQREGRRDRRIDRVTPRPHDVPPRVGGVPLLRDDRMPAELLGLDRSGGPGPSDDDQDQPDPAGRSNGLRHHDSWTSQGCGRADRRSPAM